MLVPLAETSNRTIRHQIECVVNLRTEIVVKDVVCSLNIDTESNVDMDLNLY